VALEQLDKALADLTEKLTAMAQQHGGEAVHLAAKVYQLQTIGDMLLTIPFAIGTVVFTIVCTKLAKIALADDTSEGSGIACFVGSILAGVGAFCALIATGVYGSNLFYPLAWEAAFNPNIALAAHILKAL